MLSPPSVRFAFSVLFLHFRKVLGTLFVKMQKWFDNHQQDHEDDVALHYGWGNER
jgi:hypothetical protein